MPEKPKTIADPFAYWKAFDDEELCPDPSPTGDYYDPDLSFLQEIRHIIRKKYTPGQGATGSQSSEQLGVVLQVLSGKHANNEGTTHGRKTKKLSVRGTRPWWEEISTLQGKAAPFRAIIRTFCNQILPWPKSEKDQAIIDKHPEFVALDPKVEEEQIIRPGTPVLIRFHNSSDDRHGVITKVLPSREPEIVDLVTSPRASFKSKCKSPLTVGGSAGGNYVVKTVSAIDFGPVAKKVRNKIPLGVYGNGSIQTKTHFVASLLASVGASNVKPRPAGAPGSYKNAFIWVGQLKNNGYMDQFDRPRDLGRETIIYAPKYLDVNAPIETIYYFHDKAGFGMAWIHGPQTTPDQARETAKFEGNDFLSVIAPAIKDLTQSGRNFVLIIPEMMHSRGFGRLPNQYAWDVGPGQGDKNQGADVQRTRPEALSFSVTNATYRALLDETPYMVPEGAGQSELLSENTRLVEREFSTFDGSFTGGNFVNFHSEVSTILTKHLNLSSAAMSDITITADGMSVLTVAGMVSLPNNPLSTIKPARINFIADNYDYAQGTVLRSPPSYVFYEQHITVPDVQKIQFNYVVKHVATNESPNPFFVKIGKEDLWKKSYKAGSTGQAFAFLAGSGEKTISMHLDNKPALYALTNPWSGLEARYMRDSLPKLINSEVPDHASKIAIKKAQAAMLESSTIIKQEEKNIKTFDEFLNFVSNKSTDQICLSDKWSVFCVASGSKKILDSSDKSIVQQAYEKYIASKTIIAKEKLKLTYDANILALEKNTTLIKKEKDVATKIKQEYSKPTKKKYIKELRNTIVKTTLRRFLDPSLSIAAISILFGTLDQNLQDVVRLEVIERHLKNIEDLEKRAKKTGASMKPVDPSCAKPISALNSLKSTSVPGAFSSNASAGCGPVSLPNPAPSSYAMLGRVLPYYPKQQDINNAKIEKVSGFSLSGFTHLTRKSNNSISRINSANYGTRVWACLVPIIEKAWERACVASKYVPFRGTYGYDKKARTPMLSAGKISLHNLGLALDIDTPLNPSGNDVTHGVFTNAWKYGIGNNPLIDQLGVFSETHGTMKDNVYEYSIWSGDSLRITDDWDDAPGAHDDDDLGEYLQGFHKGNVICPLKSNPLLWVLVFCESSGMKWANSTFMIKRYRGGTSWNQGEKVRLDKVFGINNVVDRVRAISWNPGGPSNLNDHMHFQWWSGKAITFNMIKEGARLNGVDY